MFIAQLSPNHLFLIDKNKNIRLSIASIRHHHKSLRKIRQVSCFTSMDMSMPAWAVLISLCAFIALLVSGRIKPATAFTGLAGCYLLTGLVDTPTLLLQYTNPALATLLLLLLVSIALERSPLLDWLSQRLLNGGPRLATAKLMGTSAVLSAFLNNTAVVSAFLGAISRQRRIAPSRLLIPLSYASVLGGVTTLVGTSTNLVVNSFYLNASGHELGMFEFALVGVPVALITLAVLLWRAHALPHHQAENTRDRLAYFLAAGLDPDSRWSAKASKLTACVALTGCTCWKSSAMAGCLVRSRPMSYWKPAIRWSLPARSTRYRRCNAFPDSRSLASRPTTCWPLIWSKW